MTRDGAGGGAVSELTIDDIRRFIEESERARWAAQFEDMGYDECETCRRARLRAAMHLADDGATEPLS